MLLLLAHVVLLQNHQPIASRALPNFAKFYTYVDVGMR